MAAAALLGAGTYYIGVLGLILVLMGWLVQSAKTFRNHKSGLSIHLSFFYALGSLLLFAYSYSIGDPVFMALNATAAFLGAANLFFSIAPKNQKQKARLVSRGN